jgi:hypothetical protein
MMLFKMCQLTFWIVQVFDGNSKSSLHGNFILKHGSILMGSELPLTIRFSLKRKGFIAKLFDAILETQFVIVNARKVFSV